MISVHYRFKTDDASGHRHFTGWRAAQAWAKRNQSRLVELCMPNECHSCCDPMNEYVGITPKCDTCELEAAVYDEADMQVLADLCDGKLPGLQYDRAMMDPESER